MTEDKKNWEVPGFRKNPYRVPEGYFESLSDRILMRINEEPIPEVQPARLRILKPWMAWVSSAAAVLLVGWLGIQKYLIQPSQEKFNQEQLAILVDYYPVELHEGQLAGFVEEYDLDVSFETTVDYQDLIEADPDMAEEIIFESLGNE